MNIKIAGITHTGMERENNEDTYSFCPNLAQAQWIRDTRAKQCTLTSQGALLIVADGVGGLNAGEVASSIALQSVAEFITPAKAEEAASSTETATQLLTQAIQKAHSDINQHIIEDFHTLGMATTIVIAWVLPQYTHVAWCGDSRCYLFSPEKGLFPLTHDHSYVQELIDKGEITENEAFTHPESNIITHAIGDVDCSTEADTFSIPTQSETTLILCTDGLCGYNTDAAISKAIHTPENPALCCNSLLQLALDAGGQDNIAIIVAHLSENQSNFFKKLFTRKE